MGKQSNQSTANPLEAALAALGVVIGADGKASIVMLRAASTDDFSGQKDEICRCDPTIALRLVERGYAGPYHEEPAITEDGAGADQPS